MKSLTQMSKSPMNKREIRKQLAVLEILTENIPFKYPKGSRIAFNNYSNGEFVKDKLFCLYYDKVGDGRAENIVCGPMEWNNLTLDEADKVGAMFDDYIVLRVIP